MGTSLDTAYETFYRLNSKVHIISNKEHAGISGLRTLHPIRDIQKLLSLKSLEMPYALCPINNDEHTQADLLSLIVEDRLKFLSFDLQTESAFAGQAVSHLQSLKNLERLKITVKVKDGLILLLNQRLNRECRIRHVDICFDHKNWNDDDNSNE